MSLYIDFVTKYPFLSAIIQFAILGTLGEIVATKISGREKLRGPSLLYKALIWAFLAIPIKIAFIGFEGFVVALILHGLLPESASSGLWNAFSRSVTMNLQFGPFLVLLHRALDNLFSGESNWRNIDKSLYSLLWFWIPAHTVTFMLPREYQIGMAALWSFSLGLILSYFAKSKKGSEENVRPSV
ncbi:hypothetical protein [Kosmotoga pacifica]|uniref:Mpv17/PMP22 n=1 Tax=Kosmotoga pacifica TaxID=1330330 RepID=A0A0G2ZD22_9BACT|nr:hypothetical protein [Kosmotoga pacifica]AKI97444.1 hypothetical protein IX53_06005 [Kosmotoga pacifica]